MPSSPTPANHTSQTFIERERLLLADYAMAGAASLGRKHAEPSHAYRSPFQRDRDRIVHSTAYRRLSGKTQVFTREQGDFHRTRLTHTHEVASVSRTLGRALRLNEDLIEALALMHDIGHPPFGHTGEDVLDECMAPFGGFDHNAQTLRALTKLERKYPDFDGLNLCWETLEGVVKHNGPLIRKGVALKDLPVAIQEYVATHDLELATWPGAEAQVAAHADDIAYNNHDLDDGLRAGLFTLAEVRAEVPMVERVVASVDKDHPGLEEGRVISETVRRLIGHWVSDICWESTNRLNAAKLQSAEDVRAHSSGLFGFSETMNEHIVILRKFLMARMYRHWRVNRRRARAKQVIKELFDIFLDDPGTLPPAWQQGGDGAGGARTARRICDYIAGMTDDYAIDEHARLHSLERPN